MALAFASEMGTANGTAASTTLAITYTAAASAGDLIIISVALTASGNTITGISDTAGNTYTVRRSQQSGTVISGHVVDCVVANPVSVGHVVTLTLNASQANKAASAQRYTGAASPAFEVANSAAASSVSPTVSQANTQADAGFYGATAYTGGAAGTNTNPTYTTTGQLTSARAYAEAGSSTTWRKLHPKDLMPVATAASRASSATLGAARDWAEIILVEKAGVAAAVVIPDIVMARTRT